jgi:transcriptional regulator GlxA family with amidase domain
MSIEEARKRASREGVERGSSDSEAIPEGPVRNSRVQIAVAFLESNLHRKITSSELAQAANLSSSHLSRLFKSQTGLSPGEYLRRLRMEKARHLIATSLLSVKEIMVAAGYNSKSHFVRHFKRSFRATPSEYRKHV